MRVKFEMGGRPVDPDKMGDALMAALLKGIEEEVRGRIGTIRHPETGEFPVVVVRGRDIENMTCEVEGSPELLAIVNERLYGAEGEKDVEVAATSEEGKPTPVAFLCHASEDKEIVRRIAQDLVANGIDVFFDEWEIRSGDSIRRKIDEGLGRCTHFIAILTPESITKEWVQTEIDAGFIQKVAGECKFIPLRTGLPVDKLTPLLRPLHSPAVAVEDYESGIAQLISDIHDVCRKPALGSPPAAVTMRTGGLGISAAAEAIVRLMVERSEHGDILDPQLEADDIREATGLSDDDIIDAVDELEGHGFIQSHGSLGSGEIGFDFLGPETELFAKFDQYFRSWNPGEDAVMIAADLVNSKEDGLNVQIWAEANHWPPRRMNPAVNFLINRKLVGSSEVIGCYPWTTPWIRSTPATRRFVKERSQ
jgi:hypothetical protein